MKKDLILMMGGQGSGKGTLSQRLINEYPNFKYVETGAMLRALPDNHPLKAIMARGEFVPDEDLQKLLLEKIDPKNDTILDGFPRQLSQAKWLIDTVSNQFRATIAVYLNIQRDLMRSRIKQRLAEGGGRADDADEAVVQKRLDSFFVKTVPAINWIEQIKSTNKTVEFANIQITDAPIDVNYQKVKNAISALRAKTR